MHKDTDYTEIWRTHGHLAGIWRFRYESDIVMTAVLSPCPNCRLCYGNKNKHINRYTQILLIDQMNEIRDRDEVKLFIQNLANIIERLKLNKSKLNEKLGWPANKLTNILKGRQEPLISDAKEVRILLGLETTDLLTKVFNDTEIDSFTHKLSDVKLVKAKPSNPTKRKSIDYIIVLLHKNYGLESEFTKKELIAALPSEFANYSIEWEKTRLKKYIKKLDKDTDSEKNAEYFFSLTEKLPAKMVEEATGAVGNDWLEETGE